MFTFSIAISCGGLPSPQNGGWNTSDCEAFEISFPTVCKLVCDKGFEVMGEIDSVKCEASGQFSVLSLPRCKGKIFQNECY